ncbi:MAG: LysM peptidoglycan-binding domain-containing protein [Nitrospirota bacterium]
MRRFYILNILISVIIIVIFFSSDIFADTSYKIKKGDNPSKIAKKFKVKLEDIIRANNLNPKNLKPGMEITIPSKEKESLHAKKSGRKEDKRPADETAITVMPAEEQEGESYHIVKKGDTLSSISKRYSVALSELREINDLRSTGLKPGQKILVKRVGPRTYIVRKGDSIYKISRRLNIDVEELKTINSLETDLIKPGQKILLEPELEGIKKYEAVLSQVRTDEDSEKIPESEDMSKTGLRERLVLFAKKLLDIPYRFGGNSLIGIDCSAYVQKVYSLIGIDLPRSAREQFDRGRPVDNDELSIGDLVFFRTYASFPSHVGIYLGNNLFIHASSRGKKVTIDSLKTPYYLKRFIGGKRLIEVKDEKKEGDLEDDQPSYIIFPMSEMS